MTSSLSENEKEFATRLEAMSDDEIFGTMRELEKSSESLSRETNAEAFAKIVLTESAIERRFPGQLLQPYKNWKKERI